MASNYKALSQQQMQYDDIIKAIHMISRVWTWGNVRELSFPFSHKQPLSSFIFLIPCDTLSMPSMQIDDILLRNIAGSTSAQISYLMKSWGQLLQCLLSPLGGIKSHTLFKDCIVTGEGFKMINKTKNLIQTVFWVGICVVSAWC